MAFSSYSQRLPLAAALLAILLSSLLAACNEEQVAPLAESTAEPEIEVIAYEHSFKGGSGGWETVVYETAPADVRPGTRGCAQLANGEWCCTSPVLLIEESMRLQSPWLHDANHAYPGAGNLALLGWVYLNGRYGAPTHGIADIDLRNAILRAEMRQGALDVKEGHLYLWVQSEMSDGMFVNLAYTAQPIDTLLAADGSWSSVELSLSADPSAWTCLGSSAARADTYRCDEVEKVISKVNFDLGFIILPVNDVPDPAVQPSGIVDIRHLEISTPSRTAPLQ